MKINKKIRLKDKTMTNEYYFTAQELEGMLSEVAADAYHAKHVANAAFHELGGISNSTHARHFDDGSAEVGGTKDKPRHTITPHGDLGFKVKNNITGKTTTHANKDSAVKHIVSDQPKGNNTMSNENYFTRQELEGMISEGSDPHAQVKAAMKDLAKKHGQNYTKTGDDDKDLVNPIHHKSKEIHSITDKGDDTGMVDMSHHNGKFHVSDDPETGANVSKSFDNIKDAKAHASNIIKREMQHTANIRGE
jgi:hypothetical protein